jgi:ABC-type multidrug transport system fused ATPase/permease subunit
VSLARALVKDSKILILDEATASVDYETDRKIQDTITTEFMTVRCFVLPVRPSLPSSLVSTAMIFLTADSIIDRLRTIISYDRICVMDNGNIAEFDAPDVLHAQNGIFRAMCEHSSITLEDIRRARKERAVRDELEIS